MQKQIQISQADGVSRVKDSVLKTWSSVLTITVNSSSSKKLYIGLNKACNTSMSYRDNIIRFKLSVVQQNSIKQTSTYRLHPSATQLSLSRLSHTNPDSVIWLTFPTAGLIPREK